MGKNQHIGFEAHNLIRSRIAELRIMLLTNAAKLTDAENADSNKKLSSAVAELDVLLKKRLSRPLEKWQGDTLSSYLDTLRDDAGKVKKDSNGVYKIPDEFVDILIKIIS